MLHVPVHPPAVVVRAVLASASTMRAFRARSAGARSTYTCNRGAHAITCLVLTLTLAFAADHARAEAWSWFVEPFTLDMIMEHPQFGTSEGRLAVAARAVRLEVTQGGFTQVMLLRLDGEVVQLTTLLPDRTFMEVRFERAAFPEVFDQGYVTAVTPPEHPQHPCTASPDIHRCTMLGTEQFDGRAVERWRVDVDGPSAAGGQAFLFDRAAELVVRAYDDTGVIITFANHVRGDPPAEDFDVPAGFERLEVPGAP